MQFNILKSKPYHCNFLMDLFTFSHGLIDLEFNTHHEYIFFMSLFPCIFIEITTDKCTDDIDSIINHPNPCHNFQWVHVWRERISRREYKNDFLFQIFGIVWEVLFTTFKCVAIYHFNDTVLLRCYKQIIFNIVYSNICMFTIRHNVLIIAGRFCLFTIWGNYK